ncbi:hypothetical protein CCZ20_28075 [Priestia aryabhattai]|uniref:hypothetical protein n=1 Tax=Priestia aryabhattai TaxID=412384 RepID=UPI000B512B82|nr:hypothetical protein [Priestia aryabhattai]OVE34143.1 hypothetical protein CCZ20_28075 [Priestia aryabhattai]
MKKLFLSTLFMLFSLILVTPTFASETDDQKLEELAQKGEIVYQDDEVTVRSFGEDEEIANAIYNHPDSVSETLFSPFSSSTGPGGRSSIVAGDSGRIVYWTVRPATAWPYNFTGTVKLRYYSGFSRNQAVGGMGALSSSVSGSVSMNKNNGGVASLSGTAHALSGDKYRVLPGVSTTFRAN